MCKEDVRLARAAGPSQYKLAAATSPGSKFLTADPNRYSIMAGLASGLDILNSYAVLVYAKIGDFKLPLIGLSGEHPGGTCSLLDVGQAIQGEIWVDLLDTNGPVNVNVADTAFTDTLENIK